MSFDASLAFCYSCDSVVSILRKNELIRAQKSLKVFLKGWKSSPNITITSKNSSSFLSVGDNNVVISNENLLNLANNKKPTDFSLVGLKNLGNTCYFNSLLQNLANLRPLVFYLTSTHEKDLLIQSSPLSSIGDRPVGEFTSTLSSFFKLFCDTANCKSGLLESRDRIIDPSKLFGLVEKASSYFKKNQQGDAHKLFRLILELLISEEKQSRLNILKSSDSTHLENSTTSSLSTLVGAIFEGKLLHVVKCLSCHEEYSTEEPFYDIHISLSKADHFVDRGTGRKNFIIKSNKAKGNGVSRCSDSSVVLPLCSSIAADKAESGGISQFFVRDLDGSLLTIRVKDNYTTSELQKAVTEQRKKLLFERNKNFNMSSSVNLSFLQLLISNQPTLKTSSPLDLYCLLRHYFKVEKLRGCNQYACSNCTRVHHSSSSKSAEWEDSSESVKAAEGQPTILVDAVRQSAILTLPHVLTIAIKRFAFCDADFRVKKLYGFVPFHLYLDLSEFCSSTCKVPAKENSFGEYRHATPSSCLYKLQGVIEHTGTLNSGHYVSYSKISSLGFNRNSRYNNENFICSTTFNANNMKDSIYSEDKDKKYIENSEVWCYASDSELKIVSVETVLKSHAFLLFYEYVFN